MDTPINLFDLECLLMETAIKAVWILYRRGKWALLEEIGLSREKYEEKFWEYDYKYIFSDHGLIRHPVQVRHFADTVPGVYTAAAELNRRYREAFSYALAGFKESED